MSERRRRRRSNGLQAFLRTVGAQASFWVYAIGANPIHAAALATMSLGLLSLIAITTLPYALAKSHPDLALALVPGHPAALIVKAERLRAELLALTRAEPSRAEPPRAGRADGEPAAAPSLAGEPGDTIKNLPEATERPDAEAIKAESEELRGRIRVLATKIIARAPLDSRGFRLLAEATDDSEQVRQLMTAALARSRHETVAAFWLLNDAVSSGRHSDGVPLIDIILRTQPGLMRYISSFVLQIAEDPVARTKIVALLAAKPPWRELFFRLVPYSVSKVDPLVALLLELGQSAAPATGEELGPVLDLLVWRGFPEVAYGVWFQLRPAAEQVQEDLLRNPSFESDPGGTPFDWRIIRGENAVAELVPLGDLGGPRALHVSFGQGRVKFPQVGQVLLLGPGHYRLEGKLRGSIVAKRGLRWQVRCIMPPRPVIAETDMLLGSTSTWRQFSIDIVVPELDCAGQYLALIHDARSPAEQLIDGEVWFDDLSLTRSGG